MGERSERGFTLVELMAVMALGVVLLTLSASALRDYSRGKALAGARDMVVTQLRHAQQRTLSEGYPRAYGIRFLEGRQSWDLVRYDASTDTCVVVEQHTLAGALTISPDTAFPDSTAESRCATAAPYVPAVTYETAFFYARGTATAGTAKILLEGSTKTRTVTVNAATGRVS